MNAPLEVARPEHRDPAGLANALPDAVADPRELADEATRAIDLARHVRTRRTLTRPARTIATSEFSSV